MGKYIMDKWFISNEKIDKLEKQIFLFPYAGGGASAFFKWRNSLENTEVLIAQYPGRENRIKEKPIEEFDFLINELYKSLIKKIRLDVPYYFLGHSLGTKMVYELAMKLKRNGFPSPGGLIISAGRAPCFKEEKPIYKLNNEKFLNEIRRFSGIPEELIKDKKIMELFLPALRADFLLDETYHNSDIEKINSPILGIMGSEDEELQLEELIKWKEYTSKKFSCKVVRGNHMFIKHNQNEVIDIVREFINSNGN